MSLLSSRPQMGSPSSTDSHYSKPMQKDVVGLPSLPDLVTSFWGVLASPFKYYSKVKAVVPENNDVNNQTCEDISLKKCKNDVRMNESIENTKVKLKNNASQGNEKGMPPAVCTEWRVCLSIMEIKNLIRMWFLLFLAKCAGATSGHCNLELRDEVVNATWSTTNGHSTLFRGNGRLIAYCDPMYNNAYLSNASDDGVYHAHFENGSICRVNFSLPSQTTEMSIQIESVTGGLDRVHINGQLVHCNNATMALANITVKVKTDGSKEAETDGRKKAETAGSIEAKTDNSDWLILLVAVPILFALGWISKLKFCGKQELDRQNLPDAA